MADLDTMFAIPKLTALDAMLGHEAAEASAWWRGTDLAGLKPNAVQDMLLARRAMQGHNVAGDDLEMGVAAVCAFLVPVALSLVEIDALHDRIADWLGPLLDRRQRTATIGRATAAVFLMDQTDLDEDDRLECLDAVQATACDFTFASAACSVNILTGFDGLDHVVIIACDDDANSDGLQIGDLPFPADDGDGPFGRIVGPVAPAPLDA